MTSLVLSGGGVFGAALLGALHALNSLNPFKVFAGTSVGALICALLVIGYTPLELLRLVMEDPLLSKPEQKLDLNRFGVASQENIRAFVERLFEEKTKARSFQEIYNEFGKELIVVGTNLSKQQAVYFQKDNFPGMNVIDALMISSCVPMVFPYIVFENEVYVDGFVTDNFPFRYVSEREKEVIGINICKKNTFIENFSTVNTYVGSLFKTFLGSKIYSKTSYEIKVDSGINQLHANPNELLSLFNEGFQQMTAQKKALKENEMEKVEKDESSL
jgi:predicted acylesterase/phospholipase RssA